MIRKERKIMRAFGRRAAAAALALGLGVMTLAGCGQKKLDGTQTAVTVNGENVTVGTLSFEAHYDAALFYSYYGAYIGNTGYFNVVSDEETGKTYGDMTVDSVLTQLEEDVIVSQHAADYGVELSEEQKAAIDAAAQAYIDKNAADVRNKIGASKEDIVYSMTLDTIRSLMMEPMAADVDTEVSDEEAQQTSVSYITVATATEDDVETAEDATDEEKQAAVEAENAVRMAKMQTILTNLLAADNAAEADLQEFADAVDDTLYAYNTSFSTNDEAPTAVNQAVADAARTLKDGEVYESVITADDGAHYYILRVDHVFDEKATQNKKDSVVRTRKQEQFDKMVADWVAAAEVSVNESAVAEIKLTDSEPFVFKAAAEESAG